jgi:hypothetical protein
MHVLGVVGLLSWFVGGGWRGSLELPRPLVIGVVSTVHAQRAIGEAALRSAIFWDFFDHSLWHLEARVTTAVRRDVSCVALSRRSHNVIRSN